MSNEVPDVYCDLCNEGMHSSQANEVPVISMRRWVVCDRCVPAVRGISPDYIDILTHLKEEANIDAFHFEHDPVRGPAYGKIEAIIGHALAEAEKVKVLANRHDRLANVKTRKPELYAEEK